MKSLTAARQVERARLNEPLPNQNDILNMNSYQYDMNSYGMAGTKQVQVVMQIPKGVSAPNLRTILMVEQTIRESAFGDLSFAELKRALPRKVNHNELKLILEYLTGSGKIALGVKGVTWTGTGWTREMALAYATGRRV